MGGCRLVGTWVPRIVISLVCQCLWECGMNAQLCNLPPHKLTWRLGSTIICFDYLLGPGQFSACWTHWKRRRNSSLWLSVPHSVYLIAPVHGNSNHVLSSPNLLQKPDVAL